MVNIWGQKRKSAEMRNQGKWNGNGNGNGMLPTTGIRGVSKCQIEWMEQQIKSPACIRLSDAKRCLADISLIKTDSVSEEFYSVDGIYTRRSVYEVKSISRFCRSSSSPHCQPQKSLQKSQCEALQVHAWTARIVAVAISSTISSPQYGVPYLSRELVR